MPKFLPSDMEYSPRERLIRMLALMGVIAIVIWAFWVHTDRQLRMIDERSSITNTHGMLDSEQLAFVRGFTQNLKREYGLDFKLRVNNSTIDMPELDSKTLFIGIIPDNQEVLVQAPPLMTAALGEDFIVRLREGHFKPYFAEDNWQQGLVFALVDIWERLSRLQGKQDG